MTEKILRSFKAGDTGIVKKVTGEKRVRRRLFDMGITPGTEIRLLKTAPLGDPLELSLRGYRLSIRKAEADEILMDVINI